MRLRSRLLALSALAAFSACRTPSTSTDSTAQSIDIGTEEGTLVLMLDGNDVKRFLCPKGREDLKDLAAVKGSCQVKGPKRFAGKEGIDKVTFDKELTALYLKSVGDEKGALSSWEQKLKEKMYKCLAAPNNCNPLEGIPHNNVVVAGQLQAFFLGMLQVVFDGDQSAPVGAAEASQSDAAEGDGMSLAAVAMAAGQFKIPIFVQQVTTAVAIPGNAQSVNTLSFQLSQGCKATFAGVSRVGISTGQQLMGPNQIVSQTGARFLIRTQPGSTAALKLAWVELVMQRAGIGPITCNVTVLGEQVGDDNPPPPGPTPCADMSRPACQANANRCTWNGTFCLDGAQPPPGPTPCADMSRPACQQNANRCTWTGNFCVDGAQPPPGPTPCNQMGQSTCQANASRCTWNGSSCSDGAQPPPPQQCTAQQRDQYAAEFMASPSMRHWHFLWHGIRNAWDQMSAQEQNMIVNQLGQRWRRQPNNADSGEEFLHMHQTMMVMVRNHLAARGCQFYPAWTAPPGQFDQTSPTYAPNVPQGGINTLTQWHNQAVSNNTLTGQSLGQYGTWLEGTLHNNWHMRHANPAKADQAFNQLDMMGNLPTNPNANINRPTQDWLGHPYSSHVNPTFWRLHGYVDERAYDWARANGYHGFEGGLLVADRTRNCVASSTVRCYRWRRIWDGAVVNTVAFGVAPQGAAMGAAPAHAHAASPSEINGFQNLPAAIRRLVTLNANMFPPQGAGVNVGAGND